MKNAEAFRIADMSVEERSGDRSGPEVRFGEATMAPRILQLAV
jgi:hypothetical protein